MGIGKVATEIQEKDLSNWIIFEHKLHLILKLNYLLYDIVIY